MDKILNTKQRARDFELYDTPKLDTFGIQEYSQEARQAQLLNEAAESVHKQLEEADYSRPKTDQDDSSRFNPWTLISGTINKALKESGIANAIADPWRQANVQGHQVNLDKKYSELSSTEGLWVPQLENAKDYLNSKQELIDLSRNIELNGYNWSDSQLAAAYTRQNELSQKIAQLEPAVKEMARTNPYLQDIFYETRPQELFKNREKFGSVKDYLKYLTYDYLNANYSADLNPNNNFKHMLSAEGVNTIFGNIGKLSPEQMQFMWDSRNKNDMNSLSTQVSQLDEALQVANARKKSKEEDIQAKINTIKKGNLLFDPTKIDPEFKAKFERNEISIDDPMSWYYALPHLGSSYSEFGAMIGQMGASAILNGVAKGALSASSGGTLPLLYAMTEAGVNYAIASYMRDSETSSEAFSAYQERVLNGANELGINISNITNQTKSRLASLGYPVDDMNDYEIFQASVAQQLKTDDPRYNEILDESKKGLEVLKQTNSALSIPDYVESTLFSYGGQWLSRAYGMRRLLGKTPNMATSAEMAQSVSNRGLAEAGNSILDNTLTRVADKISKNPMGKVATKDALSTITKLGKALGLSYFTERTEEGVQNLVSSRYQKGDYDNAEGYSLLSGAANMANLGLEANLAYYGIHPDNTLNTDKDLINEMKIGGFTGLFMTGVYGARDVYEGTKQVLTDNKLRGLTADHYADAERDNKIDQFISASKQNGNNFGRIRNSLQSLKQYKPEGVTDEMIDEDIALANTVSTYVSNKELNDIANQINATFGDTQYNQIIKNAINLRDRLNDQTQASENSTKAIEELESKIRNDNTLDSMFRLMYNQYVDELEGDEAIDFVQYRESAINNLINNTYFKVLNTIDTELSNRKQDLKRLKQDLNLDVNIDGISGIQKYIKNLKKQNKRTAEQQEALNAIALPYQEELEQVLTEKFINDGATQDLIQHNAAYIVGSYTGDTRLYRPTWDNITDAQRQSILTNAANEDEANGRQPRSEQQVIKDYNDKVNKEWDESENLADKQSLYKRRAVSVIQRDLIRRDSKEQVVRQEKEEEQGTPAEEPVVDEDTQTITTEEPATLEQPSPAEKTESPMDTMEENTPPIVPQDEMKEKEDEDSKTISQIETLVNKLEQEANPELETLPQELLDEEEAREYELDDTYVDDTERTKVQEEAVNNNQDNDDNSKLDIEIATNAVEEVTPENPINDSAEEAANDDSQSSFEEEKEDKDVPPTIEEKKPKVPEVQTPEPSPSIEPTPAPIQEASKDKVAPPTLEEGKASEVYIDPATDEVKWDPTMQQNPDNSITIGEEMLQVQNVFDEMYDDGFTGPATYANDTADMDERNPIITKSKQKRAYIANTFFYLPTTDEVMPITVAGKPVTFITKDGKVAERRPGSVLAVNLATPGWLSTVDDAYYVVTSSTHDMSGGDTALKNLAIHLIIEKDGIVYNTSLRAITQSLRDDLLNLGMTPEDVDAQISHLLALRTKIIKQYAPNYFIDGRLPLEAAKHVKPTNMRISNGTLNNIVDENGNPVYRHLNEVDDFQIPSDGHKLTEAIVTGDVEIGYGTGPFGLNPFSIVKLDQTDDTSVQGTGYAGKLYYVPKVENTPSQNSTLPIMLAEELHRIPNVNNYSEIQLSKNVDGTINRDENGKPIPMSTAEFIYELMVNGFFHNEIDEFLLGILANNGDKTIVSGLTDKEKVSLNFLVRKQLNVYENALGKRFFVNGALRNYTNPRMGYTTRYTKLDGITDSQKKRIVYEISQNIHWNTDKDLLMSRIPEQVVNGMIRVITNHPELASNDDTQIRFGNDAITFSLRELGYSKQNGKLVKVNEPILMAAWFINHGKIKTDLGDHAFKAPFVYADDVKVVESQKKASTATRSSVASNGQTIATQSPVKATPEKKQGTPKQPVIAEPATQENLDKYGLTIPSNQKLLPGHTWGIITNRQGKKIVLQTPKDKVAGVFSTVRGTNTLNAESARKWLVDTLGLDPENIIVTNAMFATGSNEKAYGIMRMVVNAITQEIMPQIGLSLQSGEGVEYHEAFHYVSLLLLNEAQRRAVYQEYVNTHSEARDYTEQQVEEALAEEFRSYMINEKNPSLRYKIVKFFKNVRDYIRALFGKLNFPRQLFKAIKQGQFKDYKVADTIAEEFYRKHPYGVTYYIPGLTAEQINNMPNIFDSQTFYSVANSLTSTALSMYNIRTIDDVHALDIDGMFDTIQDRIDAGWIAEEYIPLVEDVVSNKDIFKKNILSRLNQLGIKEVDKQQTEEDNRLDTETGDNPDNTWDKNQGDISKKDNIAFRAKLFFYSVPKYEYTFIRDEQTGVVTREIAPVLDEIFSIPTTESFNIVWNKIMENLWDIDSYQDIIDTTARLAETDPTFYALNEMFTSEENPIDDNTKTQLETTIKSAKIQMNTIEAKSDTPNITYDMSDEQRDFETAAALKRSIWEVLDSDNLRKIRRLPSRWSKAFFASANVKVDDNGQRYLDPNAVKYVNSRRTRLNILATKAKKLKKNMPDSELVLQEMKDNFIQICNAIQIPFDELALNYLLSQMPDSNITDNEQLNKFISFWSSKERQSFNNGVLGDIVALGLSGKSYIKKRSGQGTARTIDRIFNYSSKDAQINKMAVAYGKVHPSPQEFSVVGADGALVYPISENNYFSDQVRNINKDAHGKRQQILDTPYSRRSLIANAKDTNFKLHNFLALNIGESSRDYFGITPIEDYIAKLTLTFNNQMILPTMSDKKTWYSISGLQLVRDTITSKYFDEGTANYYAVLGEEIPDDVSLIITDDRRFSKRTLDIFINYWLDEFDAVFDYYVHKPFVEKNPTLRVDNYHGKIKNGKMDASGNGGRFRYFSSLRVGDKIININQDLANLEKNGSNEEVMQYLKDLKVLLLGFERVNSSEELTKSANIYQAMNNLLVGATTREMNKLVNRGILGFKNGRFVNKLIPYNIYSYYKKAANNGMYTTEEGSLLNEDILYSIIGSHVANSALSIIEVEKCFTGDPAYYKWKKFNKEVRDDSGEVIASYDVISGRDVDKIKRLSAVLSTGTNLRTIWDNPAENDTSISVLHLKDNEIGSEYYGELYKIFRNSILRDLLSQRYPAYTDDMLIEALNTEEKEQKFYDSLDKEQQKFVDSYSKNSANPYSDGAINQSDAAVYVRPALYRRIMKALGNWSDEIEEAYRIMEGEDESWLNDPVKYAKTTSALINPLKMVYFGDHRDSQLNLNIPVFDKMAMFPMFKVLAKGDNRLLYERMNNEELGTIDMLTFESAVKVGGRQKYQTYLDSMNNTFNIEDLGKPSYDKYHQEGNLPVFKQDISNLRLQLNTSPHEHLDRSFGTQAVKICLGNLIDNRTYGNNKGQSVTGAQIKERVMSAINRLSVRGANDVLKRFLKDGTINNKALSDYLISQAVSSGMSDEVIDGFKLDENGEFRIPLAATSSRNWVESRIISYINKQVVDLNTPGGSAIQMSSFGFKATGARKQSAIGTAFNDGKKLRFLNKDGSMDVMLSTNFFRHIVPKEYQGSYGQMRRWLLEKGIIGKDATPMGVGYRIPTQGLSSTFSFKVVDVLPDRIGDTIIVPDEFTAMTGSDFDVDKLYLATLNYDENGNIMQYETDEEGNVLPEDKQSTKALQNMIIQSYQLVVSDSKNMAETRASIDTLTKLLQKDILPLIQPSVKEEALPMYELLPSFQLARKEEYTGGKAGIAPFALNSTNHCLTQLVHLQMIYTKGNPYGLGTIDAIRGRDGFRILDWLSAMINAHVDVAKDPYIMALNVNQVTYNMTNLLLRGGMGKTTFYFLAQPILKEFADSMIANKGVYGVTTQTENQVVATLYDKYFKQYKSYIDSLDNNDPTKYDHIKKYNSIADEVGIDLIYDKTKFVHDRSTVFNDSSLINGLTTKDPYTQLIVLKAYNELNNDAKRLSELVHRSQIDTKKFGNTLAQQMNFRNSYETFIYDNAEYFIIEGQEFDEKNPQEALRTYFGKTFLSTKLHHGTSLPRKLLRSQAFPATQVFQNIFTSAMGIFGQRKDIVYNNGQEAIAYKHIGDKKFVNRFSSYIDSIIRARLSRDLPALHATDEELVGMLYGEDSMCKRLTGIKQYIMENKDRFPSLIGQDGYIRNQLLNYLQEYQADGTVQLIDRIVLSDSSLSNDYETENQLVSAFAELLESDDPIVREFANDLAKYAYLTSYDERGSNNFFNLVPNKWKEENGYVNVIKEGLKSFKSSSNQAAYASIAEENDNAEALYFPSINITIARNLWQDDSVVQPFEINAEKGDKVLHRTSERGRVRTTLKTDLFATSRSKKEFIKVVNGAGTSKVTELYRKVGQVSYINEEGETVGRGTKYIYQRIPKLGVIDNGFRVMEFQKHSLEPSAFEANSFNYNALLTEGEIEALALKAIKDPKAGSGFTKQFFPGEINSIKARIEQDAKEIAGTEDGNPVMDNVSNIDVEDVIVPTEDVTITPEMMQEATDFVYGTIETEDFTAIEAIEDFMQQIEDVSQLTEVFEAQSAPDIETVSDTAQNESFEDMSALAELGKKRRKECE